METPGTRLLVGFVLFELVALLAGALIFSNPRQRAQHPKELAWKKAISRAKHPPGEELMGCFNPRGNLKMVVPIGGLLEK